MATHPWHDVPLPDGETYNVVIVAACDAAGMAAKPAAVSTTARIDLAVGPVRGGRQGSDCIVCLSVVG